MVDPVRHRQLEELDMVRLCARILGNARNELYLNMHFLDLSLSSLGFEADPPGGEWGQMGLLSGITRMTCALFTAGGESTSTGHFSTWCSTVCSATWITGRGGQRGTGI